MEREKLESLIIDHIDGKLAEADRASLEKHLASDPEAFKLYEQFRKVIQVIETSTQAEPSARLRTGFDQMLAEEIRKQQPEGRQVFFRPVFFRAAAAIALVLSGVVGGYWISQNAQEKAELAKLKEEVQETKRIMQAMLDNQGSASQRLQGVTVALNMNSADDDVVNALVSTMNDDPSSNVRLAALDALSKFQHEANVRKALIKSLSTQKDPIVQIALIQLLVRMKEKSVIKDLERMVDDEHNIKAVKDEASSGILKLS